MRITRRDLKRLIEAFVVGPDGDVTVPTTDKQKGKGLPQSLKLETRIASLLAAGLNAVNNHNFQFTTQNHDINKLKKLKTLFYSDDEANQASAMSLIETLFPFEDDVNVLRGVAINAIQSSADYTTLISDIVDYLKGTRSDKIFRRDYRNQEQGYNPKDYIDMIINTCLEKHFKLYQSFIDTGSFKPGSDYHYPLTGLRALEYLDLDYILTGSLSVTFPNDAAIFNMMKYVFDKDLISGGVAQQKLSDPRQAYIEGDDPFVVIKFTVYCNYEDADSDDSSLALDDLKTVIDDNYSVFVTREPVTYVANYARGSEEKTYYMLTVSGRLSEFEVTSVDEIENSWLDKQFLAADDLFSSGGFNRPCYMKISEYEEKVLYRNIRELGEIIMKVARAKNYGPAEVKSLRRLISADQTNNDYYREELAIVMATYSDMIGFTKELAADISDETGVTLDEVINPEDYR